MEKYLDITKSVIISSPAGSGKTEKLARRYIGLLLSGSEIEKILAVTFTEKAAAEMKDRVLSILERENPDLFMRLRDKMPLMRVTTIHSFCLKLLKRFSVELGLDPSLEVIDEFTSSLLWSESVYECLLEEKNQAGLFYEMIITRGMRGWDSLQRILNELHKRRPHPDLLLREAHPVESEEEKRILELYSRCLQKYGAKKSEKQLLDFDDLELLAYEALVKNPEWHNILYSFDEHTDHILVDEFQDTSSLQWKIIDKLTEEWRSGMGSKRESGKIPTIFLVGDEKQSIYLFRGANVSVFQEAREKLSEWLGKEYHFEEVKENYRSLPAVTQFANSLFERLMHPCLSENWRTRYVPFEAIRRGDGQVEIILTEGAEGVKKNREKEASVLTKRILSLVNHYEIFDGNTRRPCSFGDMAILLRRRTHLTLFEDALRRHGVPFIVVKGIGFYDEPEVALLRELLFLLIDPKDDCSLFCVLRSPLFGVDYKTLQVLISQDKISLFEKLQTTKSKKLHNAYLLLAGWIERSKHTPLAILLENALSETGGWQYYWEKQRHANLKKFIRIIEVYESQGFSSLEIREKLIKARFGDEAKANVNTEGMDAVKIMTVHAAKGLEFPMVFLPSLDEDNSPKGKSIVLDEEGGRIVMAYEEDAVGRKKREPFVRRKEKEKEEEKRLFYVAVTRAKDFLCLLGAWKKDEKVSGRLAYLTDSFGVSEDGTINSHNGVMEVMNESRINEIYLDHHSPFISRSSRADTFLSELTYTEPLSYEPPLKWQDVTEEMDIKARHGEGWVLLGKVFHKLFEEISKGMMGIGEVETRAATLLKYEIFNKHDLERMVEIIKADFEKLSLSGYLRDIVLPSKHSYVELPFVLQKGTTVFRGRIDRLIIKDNVANIYDYKTFPAKEKEFPELIYKYRFQMDIYREAVEKILKIKSKCYLLFTHLPLLEEM
jgi:ATP-dependent helicase/nuclease subunit A